MSNRILGHLRSNVVGYVALFMMLGGAAYALPGKNVVDKNDLKKNVVKTKNVKNGAITTDKLAANAATGAKVAEESLDFTCPAGERDAVTVCFDGADRSAGAWAAAAEDCADEGGTLPSITDWLGAVDHLGLSAPFQEYWTSIKYEDGGAAKAMIFRASTGISFSDGDNTSHVYRCAFPLVRN